MSDSILNETITNLSQKAQLTAPKQLMNAPGDDPPGNYMPYFRHNGIKVKIEDIELVLLQCEQVSQAVVLYNEDKEGTRRLIAYIVPKSGVFNQLDFIQYLDRKLPAHMIPALWVCLEKFPLTPHGNIDKEALPEPGKVELKDKAYLAPRNETETKLAAIVQELLGLEAISIEANFFRLGGSSLQALKVISAVRKEFDLDLDMKYFFIYPTIAQLAGYLRKQPGNDLSIHRQSTLNGYQQWPSTYSSSIVPIKAGNDKMPLYIVCGGGGSAFTFEKFAYMLDEDQPVYGVQQPSNIDELEKFPDSIEGIAAKYVNELLLIDREGPYALSGHCIGGLIALEMARELKAMGKQVKLLAMFDVILPNNEDPEPATFKNFYHIPGKIKKLASKAFLKLHFETFLLTRYPKDALGYKISSLKSLVNKVYRLEVEDIGTAVFRQFEQKFENAFERYQLKKFDGDILVFYAKDRYRFLDKTRNIRFSKMPLEEETKNKWKSCAKTVTLYQIEGEHSTMFEPLYSKDFAKLLQHHLKISKEE
ncbi:MAG: hypothetical protein H7Z13_00740 [Ferruginibacter sp.]|nr:hypothetical protein [Ferruginibacter sp.]